MNLFDYNTISDEAIRTEYKHILIRGKAISESVCRAYGHGRKNIKTIYISNQMFNSFASDNGDHYLIEVDSSVPLFSMILFSRLISDASILPFLSADGDLSSNYSLPFIIDPASFENREDWEIKLNAPRSFAAGTLADICSTFVLCHEIGHIICGHIEGLKHYEGNSKIAELVSYSSSSKEQTGRRQTWEYDAGTVAATLLMNFADELFANTQDNKRTAEMFDMGEDTIPHILSIMIVTLFAFFSYTRGVRHQLGFKSSHPHPVVRAFYFRDMLIAAAKNRWELDEPTLFEFIDIRLAEMMGGLEKIALFDGRVFSEDYIDQINAERKVLSGLRKKYKHSCQEWAWISWG